MRGVYAGVMRGWCWVILSCILCCTHRLAGGAAVEAMVRAHYEEVPYPAFQASFVSGDSVQMYNSNIDEIAHTLFQGALHQLVAIDQHSDTAAQANCPLKGFVCWWPAAALVRPASR